MLHFATDNGLPLTHGPAQNSASIPASEPGRVRETV
jgi:hypothetical protein